MVDVLPLDCYSDISSEVNAMTVLRSHQVALEKNGKVYIGLYNTISRFGRVEDPVKDVVVDYIESDQVFTSNDFVKAGYIYHPAP
jgi:TFIIF-interacting CTD phosphatase-like protein